LTLRHKGLGGNNALYEINEIYAFYAIKEIYEINAINAIYAIYAFYAINAVRFCWEMIDVGYEREVRKGWLGGGGRRQASSSLAECHSATQQSATSATLRCDGEMRPMRSRYAMADRKWQMANQSGRMDEWTHSLPLARPSRASGFAQTPFGASQAAQVTRFAV
jgi:hypothetical protein